MNDITLEELIASLPNGDVKTWWQSVTSLPETVSVNEFFYKTLKAAHLAARAKNASLPAGQRIDGYPAPTYGTTVLDSTSGIESQVVTSTLRTRVALNPDIAVSTLA